MASITMAPAYSGDSYTPYRPLLASLWKDTFALTNADEFFAEMSQSYFCTNPPIPTHLHNGVNCAGALRAYDLATAALMDSIYKGTADLR